jgi:coenzyme F420-0:L-glutamate ligase/coenzyme F420-1:gamma-L-glutamate ligase
VVISDRFGRPWREGQVNVAIGAAGVAPLRDYRGRQDPDGYELQGTELAVVDELASAAELVMGKLDRVPVALVRGASLAGEGRVQTLLRDPLTDLFR